MVKAPRGTHDVLPDEIYKWHMVEAAARQLCRDFGYGGVRTPMFEHTELFERGVGETTDVVQKEMYTFTDKGDRSITLRPEGTSPVVRSFVENSLYAGPQPTKLYYISPCFRYEKPQAGRLREFHQFGGEVVGAESAAVDAEIISMAMLLFKRLGVSGVELEINSIGCPQCRRVYNERLKEFFKPHLSELCETCRGRYEKNPLRILDCKSDSCKKIYNSAPVLLDHICPDCLEHFESLKGYLEKMGIEYRIDPTIVRGLDYYTKTVFEIVSKNIGAQGTVCGGGRYNGLVSELSGPEVPGVGFGLGIERLILMMDNLGLFKRGSGALTLFIANIGDKADGLAQKLVYDLRSLGVSAERDYLGRSVKAQMKYANKLGAKFSTVIGDDDIAAGRAVIKNMENGEACEVPFSELVSFFSGERV